MKILNILIVLLFVYNSQAKWCNEQKDCGDSQYYTCKNHNCCKNSDLKCGAGYSWPCCNGCRITGINAWGTCK